MSFTLDTSGVLHWRLSEENDYWISLLLNVDWENILKILAPLFSFLDIYTR